MPNACFKNIIELQIVRIIEKIYRSAGKNGKKSKLLKLLSRKNAGI
jgi:hypothetical protein